MADWSLRATSMSVRSRFSGGHLAGAAEQAVHQRERQPRRDDQQADAFERLGFEQRDVGGVGQASR